MEIILLLGMGALALIIAIEDYRDLEIHEAWLFAILFLALSYSILFPPEGSSAIAGVLTGIGAGALIWLIGTLTGKYRGHEALGSADLLLAITGGFLLGPHLFALWVLSFSMLSLLLWRLLPRFAGVRIIAIDELSGQSRQADRGRTGEGQAHEKSLEGESLTESAMVEAMPLCPAMLITGAAIFTTIKLGFVDVLDPLGLSRLL